MKYRDIIGIPKKKKVIKEQKKNKKPSIKNLLEEEFGPTAKAFGNRNVGMKADTGPKRWTGSGLTEHEKAQMNEGPAYEYSRDITNIDKAGKLMTKAIKGLDKTLKKKGFSNKKVIGLWMRYFKNFEDDLDDILRELI